MPSIYLTDKQRRLLLNMLHDERELVEDRVEYGWALPGELEEVFVLYNKLTKEREKK